MLRDLQGWLLWRYEEKAGETKPIKVPYYADGGKRYGANGSPTDRAKMVKFAAARDAAAKRGMDGVGLALMPEFGITATDFDHCVDADGNVPHEIEQIAARTYTEYSPSGAGVRAFSVGRFGNRKSPTTPGQYGFETFETSGFVTFTGNILPICELLGEGDTVANDPTVNAIIQNLCDTRFAPRPAEISDDFMAGHEPRLGLTVETMLRILSHISPDISRDEWIRVGMALHHECEGDDTGFDLWDDWSADGATYPGSEGLRVQWDSFDRRAGQGHKQTTMASVIHMAKKDGYVHTRPDNATSPENVMARVEAITAELRTDRGRFATMPIYELSLLPPGEWLIKGVLPDGDLVVLFGASGSGKAQPLDEYVLTAQGWRTMGEIAVGDEVIGSAGLPVRVSGVFPQGLKEEWELLTSDGERVRCCGEHLWTVRKPGKRWQTLTTAELAAKAAPRSRWQLPVVAPVSFAHDPNPLPLDPYLLGALLGDGGLTSYVGFTSADQQIVDEIAKVLPAGHHITKKSTGDYAYMITSAKGQPNHIWTALRLLGLAGKKSEAKHIPEEYLLAAPSARLALLQGLMDTDGYVADGNGRTAVFSSASAELTAGVAELVQSLGGLCTPIRVKKTTGLPAHSVSFRSGAGFTPFRLQRKAERCSGGHNLIRAIVSATPTGRMVPMQCISVQAEDKLYVTTGYTLTHNTFVALDMAFAVAQGLPWRGNKTKKGKVVIIAAEGAGGLTKRVKAYAKLHGIDLREVEIHIISAAPNFLEEEDIAEVLAEVKALGDVALVVVDTLAQVTPGANENGAEDMGRALANLRMIREVAGATVMAVHHAGKDASKGSRGWSGIKAAADAQIEVLRHEDGQREIHLEKMKDGEDGLRFGFKLEIVELGLDADGDMLTSCVAIEADLPGAKSEDKPSRGVVRYGGNERHVLEVIESEYAAVESVSEALFVARCAELLPKPDAGKRDQRLFLMRRAVQSLVKRKDGPLAVEHGRVIFCL